MSEPMYLKVPYSNVHSIGRAAVRTNGKAIRFFIDHAVFLMREAFRQNQESQIYFPEKKKLWQVDTTEPIGARFRSCFIVPADFDYEAMEQIERMGGVVKKIIEIGIVRKLDDEFIQHMKDTASRPSMGRWRG